jgi:hypothetical protein
VLNIVQSAFTSTEARELWLKGLAEAGLVTSAQGQVAGGVFPLLLSLRKKLQDNSGNYIEKYAQYFMAWGLSRQPAMCYMRSRIFL